MRRGLHTLLQGIGIYTRALQGRRKTLHIVAHDGIAELGAKLHSPRAWVHAKRMVGHPFGFSIGRSRQRKLGGLWRDAEQVAALLALIFNSNVLKLLACRTGAK